MITQDRIIKELNVIDYQDDTQRIINERVRFIKEQLVKSKTRALILGISGGVDSLTAGLLCQQAVDELRSQEYDCQFIAVKMPYAVQADEKYVAMAINTIQPDKVQHANIQSIVDQTEQWLDDPLSKHDDHGKDFIRGNIKARTRMTIQYTLANCFNGLVVGTNHAAEAVNGFFTKYGDGACDIAPLFGLVKQTVRDIAKEYGAVPELYNKVATADLEDLKVNLPDEEALGMSYDVIDRFLQGEKIDDVNHKKIVRRYVSTEHKRQLPITPHVDYHIDSITMKYIVDVDDMDKELQTYFELVETYCDDNKIKPIDVFSDIDHVCNIIGTFEEETEYDDDACTKVESIANWLHELSDADAFKLVVRKNRIIGIQYHYDITVTNDFDGMMKLLTIYDECESLIQDDNRMDFNVVDMLSLMKFLKI